ncbi:MAG: hypothetical protein K2W96_15490, partial [Gemmataceae bacterium]|nr:hypothetical protein [Gemmataceae bacterium]
MFGSLRLFLVPLAAAGLLALAPVVQASKAALPAVGTTGVEDGAKLFSKEAKEKAEKRIDALVREYRRGVLIETMDNVPERFRDKVKGKDTRNKAFADLALERYKAEKVGGAYLLIVKGESRTQASIGDRARDAGFTPSKR